jgi:hypothetical protein
MVAAISDQLASEWAAVGEVARLLGVGAPGRGQCRLTPGYHDGGTAGLKLLRRENAALQGAAVFEDRVGFLRGSPRRAACPSRSSRTTTPRHPEW